MKILKFKVFAIIFLPWIALSAWGGTPWEGTLKDFDTAKVDTILIMLEDGRRFAIRSDGVAMAAVTNSGLDSAFGPLDKVAYEKFFPRLKPFLTESAKDRTDIVIRITQKSPDAAQANPKISATAYVPRNKKEVLEILREIASIVTPRNPQRFHASLERNPIKGLEDLVFGDKAAKQPNSQTVRQPDSLASESGNAEPSHLADPKLAPQPPISPNISPLPSVSEQEPATEVSSTSSLGRRLAIAAVVLAVAGLLRWALKRRQ